MAAVRGVSGIEDYATRRYRHGTLILESVFETDEGSVRAIEFMPPRGMTPDIVRIVEGLDGNVRMRSELVIRFHFGKVVPWVRRIMPGWRSRGLTRFVFAPRSRSMARR